METDTVLKREEITDTISQTDVVEEEANTEAIDKIKMRSNKICICSDLAKKNMMFCPESCQAIMDMGNVELTESMPIVSRPRIGGNNHMFMWKHIRTNHEMIARIWKAFDILKTPFFRTSRPNSKGYKCGY